MSPETVQVSPAPAKRKISWFSGFSFMNMMKWCGTALLVFVLFVLTYLYLVDPFAKPEDIRVTNMTPRSATVSWKTEKAAKGVVIYGEKDSFYPWLLASVGQGIAYDDRDVTKAVNEGAASLESDLAARDAAISSSELETDVSVTSLDRYYVHHVTVKNLDPSKEYFFMVGDGVRFVNGDGMFADDEFTLVSENNFTTFPELEDLESPDPTYGKVTYFDDDSVVVDDGILFMKSGLGSPSAPLSSVLNSDGNWYLDISSARDSLIPTQILTFDTDNDVHSIFVEAGKYGESQPNIYEPMYADAPMADIGVSKNWDEDESQSISSLIFGVFAAKEDENSNLDPKKYKENGKIRETYAEQVKRRLQRGDYVNLTDDDVEALKRDRKIDVEKLKPKTQETATSSGSGGSCASSQSGKEYVDTGIAGSYAKDYGDGGTHNYRAVCCNVGGVGYFAAWTGSGANKDCQSRWGETATSYSSGDESNQFSISCGANQIACKRNGKIFCDAEQGCILDGGHKATEQEISTYEAQVQKQNASKISCSANQIACTRNGRVFCDAEQGCILDGGHKATATEIKTYEEAGNLNSLDRVPCRANFDGSGIETLTVSLALCEAKNGTIETPEPTPVEGNTDPVSVEAYVNPNPSVVAGNSCNNDGTIREGRYGLQYKCLKGRWVPYVDISFPKNEDRNTLPDGRDSIETSYSCDDDYYANEKSKKEYGDVGCMCPGSDTYVEVGGTCRADLVEGVEVENLPTAENSAPIVTAQPVATPAPQPTQTPTPPESLNINFINPVFAQNSIIVSPESGVYTIEQSGIYCTKYSGSNYCFNVMENGTNVLYIDKNNNNMFDAGDIDLGDDGVKIPVTLATGTVTYKIVEGFNLVSFKLVNSETGSTAKEMLKHLNGKYSDAFYSIARFDSGKWDVIENRNGETYGEGDFQIVPGKGYLLKAKLDMNLTFTGKAVSDAVPIALSSGWNLIGINGNSKAYTAESLIDAVNSSTDVTADNVTKWDTSLSRYVGLEKETGVVYGVDYPLTSTGAYFVRVVEGKGAWTPE